MGWNMQKFYPTCQEAVIIIKLSHLQLHSFISLALWSCSSSSGLYYMVLQYVSLFDTVIVFRMSLLNYEEYI